MMHLTQNCLAYSESELCEKEIENEIEKVQLETYKCQAVEIPYKWKILNKGMANYSRCQILYFKSVNQSFFLLNNFHQGI